MKNIVILTITLLLVSFTLSSNSETTVFTVAKVISRLTEVSKDPISITDWLVREADIYFQGWVRYYHYNSNDRLKEPRLFFQNDKFYDQRVSMSDVHKGDKYGEFKIPNKVGFFLVLKNETLNMYASRSHGLLDNVVDGLNIEFIDHVSKLTPGTTGIVDFGEHSIGSCLEITAQIPKVFKPIYRKRVGPHKLSRWIICMDKKKDKFNLLQTLIKLKVKLQENRKDPFDERLDEKELREGPPEVKTGKKTKKQVPLPKDGYWMLLQDWTKCTLKCGGGASYQQFMCVPPKNGGRPCKGEAVRMKPCNTQPCESVEKVLKKGTHTEEVRQMQVENRRMSTRPQKYSVCESRENDAFLVNWDPVTKSNSKRPIRVVMNKKTVSIYNDDNYHELFYSYDLKESQLSLIKQPQCCFIIRDNFKATQLCGYPENCSLGSNLSGPVVGVGDSTLLNAPNGWAKSWASDFVLFKITCKTGRQGVLLTENDLKNLPKKDDNEGSNTDMMKAKLEEEENNEEVRRIQKTTDLGFRAIQKENDLEHMIQDEENEKGKEELDELRKKIEDEKKKLNCLHKKIDEKDVFEEHNSKAEENNVKARFQRKIQLKRKAMKDMLEKMRRKQKLKRTELEAELKDVKAQISKDLLRANYVGDIKKCIRGKNDLDYRDSYCNSNFVESYLKNQDCRTDDSWCEVCCEHEFGKLYIQKRYKCFDICDEAAAAKKASEAKAGPGQWMYVAKYKTGGNLVNPTRG